MLAFANETTGIKQLQLQTAGSQWYTIDGRRLNAAPAKAGIYVVNGRKVVVK